MADRRKIDIGLLFKNTRHRKRLPNYHCLPEHYPKSINSLLLENEIDRDVNDNDGGMKVKIYKRSMDNKIMNSKILHDGGDVATISEDDENDIYDDIDEDYNISIRCEFEKLKREKYTHSINMPGDLNVIAPMAQSYKIIPLDFRMSKYVADQCKLLLCQKKQ
jgi:hypothetical protein